jgi:hypothetical protein
MFMARDEQVLLIMVHLAFYSQDFRWQLCLQGLLGFINRNERLQQLSETYRNSCLLRNQSHKHVMMSRWCYIASTNWRSPIRLWFDRIGLFVHATFAGHVSPIMQWRTSTLRLGIPNSHPVYTRWVSWIYATTIMGYLRNVIATFHF